MNRIIVIALYGVLLASNIRCQKQEGANLAAPVKDSSGLSAKLAAVEKAAEAMLPDRARSRRGSRERI